MAHHSGERSPLIDEMFRRSPTEPPALGPTGQFPEGKLTPEDEGEIRVGITHLDGKVVMDFGKPTAWIGFTAEQADQMAAVLRTHAAIIRGE